jgi:fluoride ion exporter CrcB/FEX
VNASALIDGVHTLTVTASQSDGLSTNFSTTFSTNAHQLALERQASNLLDYAYVLAVLGLVALIVGIVALRRGSGKSVPSAPAPQV